METIIHIGQPKTGTSSLQYYLFQHRDELKRQGFFFTDKILIHRSYNHYLLNIYALDKNRFSPKKEVMLKAKGKKYLDELNEKLPLEIKNIYNEARQQKCGKIIWSNEGLYLLNSKKEYEKLINLFKPYSNNILVYCCFRDKLSFKESYLNQLKRVNISSSNKSDSYRYLKSDSWLFDYDRKKSLLRDVFDECIFFDYNSKDNVKPFLELINIQLNRYAELRLNKTKNNKIRILSKNFSKILRHIKWPNNTLKGII